MATITFENEQQAALWDHELVGQLSDGFWENASPHYHWEPWCRAECKVDPHHPGRDFHVDKDSYAFTSARLLDVVGDRMLAYYRAAAHLEPEDVQIVASLLFSGTAIDWKEIEEDKSKSEYYAKKAHDARLLIEKYGEAYLDGVLADASITFEDMKDDLRRMRKIIKILKPLPLSRA